MLDNLDEIQGFFTTPSAPGVSCVGTLFFNPVDGPQLTLLGYLKTEDRTKGGDVKHERIEGVLENGLKVVLHNCSGEEAIRVSNHHGIGKSWYRAEYLVIGKDTVQELVKKGAVCFLGQDDWLRFPIIRDKKRKEGGRKYTVSVRIPAPIKIFTCKDYSISITHSARLPYGGYLRSIDDRFSIKSRFVFEFKKPFPVECFLEEIRQLEYFLGITSHVEMPICQTFVQFEDKSENSGKEEAKVLHYRHPKHASLKQREAHDFLLDYAALKRNFQNVYDKWRAFYWDIEPALDLLFEHRYNEVSSEMNKFVYFSSAFESIHRSFNRGSKVFPEKSFKKVRKDLIASCPKKYRERIRMSLAYSNQYTLRERYLAGTSELRNEATLFSDLWLDKHIGKILKTRNAQAHGNRVKGDGFVESRNVYAYNLYIQLIITYCVLRELGISKRRLIPLISRNNMFDGLLNIGHLVM